jgi:hypothetical protein
MVTAAVTATWAHGNTGSRARDRRPAATSQRTIMPDRRKPNHATLIHLYLFQVSDSNHDSNPGTQS